MGDSRAIMATMETDINQEEDVKTVDSSQFKCIVLSRDHKPELDSERKRILS